MFLLDTNVLSALMGSQPVPRVAAWIAGQPEYLLFTAAVCQAEVMAGIAVLPAGHRRAALHSAASAIFKEDFQGRVLPFDAGAAATYGELFASRKRAGHPTAPLDLMIAAIARDNGATVVTRDTGGFEACGVPLIDPWQAS